MSLHNGLKQRLKNEYNNLVFGGNKMSDKEKNKGKAKDVRELSDIHETGWGSDTVRKSVIKIQPDYPPPQPKKKVVEEQ